jgi:hypothetical protein
VRSRSGSSYAQEVRRLISQADAELRRIEGDLTTHQVQSGPDRVRDAQALGALRD